MSQTCRKKNYGENDLKEAIKRVKNGELTQYKACKLYNIPKQTLSAWVIGKAKFRQGRPNRLSNEEEATIAEICGHFSDWGIGLGKKHVIGIVADFLKAKNKSHLFVNGVPSRYWWSNF